MSALYTHTTRAEGTILTAAIYNADHVNHVTNGIPAQLDDYSASLAQMRLETDPGEVAVESQATALSGEIERIRFAIHEMKTILNNGVATTYWYESASGAIAGTVADNAITNAKLRDSVAVSIIGRSANTSGDPADIVAAANGQYLGRSGDAVAFKSIAMSDISGAYYSGTLPNVDTSVSTLMFAAPDAANTSQSWLIGMGAGDGQALFLVTAPDGSGSAYKVSTAVYSSMAALGITGLTITFSGNNFRLFHSSGGQVSFNWWAKRLG